jgi:hypothetical protein
MKHFITPLIFAGSITGGAHATTIIEDFEGITIPALPASWTLVGTGGATAANGNPGNSFDPAAGSLNYLTNSGFTGFSASQNFSGSFDYTIGGANEFYDAIGFWVGDVDTGLTTGAGNFFRVDLKRATFGRRASIYDGSGYTDTDKLFNGDGDNNYALSVGTQYTANFTWTASTGTFEFDLGRAGDATDVMSFTGYSFNDNEVHFGFGTSDVTGNFDNISLTGTTVPEPSAALLGGIGALLLLRRRRH